MTFLTLALIHFIACITPGPALMYALNVLADKDLKFGIRIAFDRKHNRELTITKK